MMDYEDDVNLSDLWKANIYFLCSQPEILFCWKEKKKQKKIRIKFKKNH